MFACTSLVSAQVDFLQQWFKDAGAPEWFLVFITFAGLGMLIYGFFAIFQIGNVGKTMATRFGIEKTAFGIIIMIFGVFLGGISAFALFTTSPTGTITPNVDVNGNLGVSVPLIESCTFAAGTSLAGNITIEEDVTDQSKVYIEIDESEFLTHNTDGDINLTFNCVRKGLATKGVSVKIVAKSEEFADQVITYEESTLYNILETSSSKSITWNDRRYTQEIYLSDGGFASTSDTREFTGLGFAEKDSLAVLGVLGEIDENNLQRILTKTQGVKSIKLYERTADDKEFQVAEVIIQKVA
jgi:hypothetical protein